MPVTPPAVDERARQTSHALPLSHSALSTVHPSRAVFEKLRNFADVMPMPRSPMMAPMYSQRLADPARRLLVCSGAAQKGLPADDAIKLENITFGSGERFVVIQGELTAAPVMVAQGFDAVDEDICDRVVEMLQTVWAARSSQCQHHIVLQLPNWCDPQENPTPFNRLLPKLAKASGAAEIRYETQLGTGEAAKPGWLAAKALIEHLEMRLQKASTREGAQSIYRLAEGLAKQAGRRSLVSDERAWRLLAYTALRISVALPAVQSQAVVVFGVEASHTLRDALAGALPDASAAKVGQHVLCTGIPDVALGTEVEGSDVVVVHGMRPAPSAGQQEPFNGCAALTLEALLLVQAARDNGAKRISVVQAYQMNGRSDIEEHRINGEHAGAYAPLVAKWFDAVKSDAAILIECHDAHTPTAWSSTRHGHAQVVSGARMLMDDLFASLPDAARQQAILAIPDAGGAKRLKHLRGLFNRTLEGRKLRREHKGEATLQSLGDEQLSPETSVVLIDDETAGGATLAQSLKMLRDQGARQIHALVVHNNLSLDTTERNLLLAWFRHSGATSMRFSNTHAMGPVASSLEALLAMSPHPSQAARRVAAFLAEKKIAATPEQFFAGLSSSVHVVCCAATLAACIRAA